MTVMISFVRGRRNVLARGAILARAAPAIDRLVEIYNSNLLVLDTHAPLTCKTLISRPKFQ